ncbi:hypothetical protein FHG87_009678 [Trinorchestia longiramus]|nr:hypothetical protein FHG87_009678 [Trinorchestia longiramus]
MLLASVVAAQLFPKCQYFLGNRPAYQHRILSSGLTVLEFSLTKIPFNTFEKQRLQESPQILMLARLR